MARNDVKINLKGVNSVMKSSPVQALVTKEAHKLAQKAGKGYVVVNRPHRWVARSYVRTGSQEAAQDQAENYTLQRVLGGGA